ncbi:MAG: hypothetical protein K2X29_12790 [Candidatus Obscuribacterales bacterium]|nr:hypothetical protein [Candidatus Obscuribacterales bacterium]
MAEANVIVYALAAFALVMLVVPILVMVFVWGNLSRYLERRKQKRLASLAHYHARLLKVINHLLVRADHVDQLSKFYAGQTDDKWSQELANACEKLVVLTESTKLIESSLSSKSPGSGEENLLSCIRVAHYVLIRLSNLERQLGKGESKSFRVKNQQSDKMQS